MIGLFGSGEFTTWAEPVDRLLLDFSSNGSDRVLILPTASAPEGDDVFDEWGRMGTDHYRRIGAKPEVVSLRTREDAHRADLVGQIEGAGLIFFSGGNPGYVARVLAGTPFWQEVIAAVRSGTSLAGCSAGAAMLGTLAPDVTSDSVAGRLSNLIWLDGLKVYPKLLIGAHWDALESYVPGLRQFVIGSIPAGCVLLGVDDETAVVGTRGRWTVHGRGKATIIEPGGDDLTYGPGEPFELAQSIEVLDLEPTVRLKGA